MSRVSLLAINAADHLASKGRLDAAASILRNYLSNHPPRAEILQRLGRILLAQGRTAEAVPLLEQALSVIREQENAAAAQAAAFEELAAQTMTNELEGHAPSLDHH